MTPEKKNAGGRERHRWHLLIHSLPPEPLYLRAKIRQRLLRAGAIALKGSVYVLPGRADCLEAFRSIAQDAIAGGGKAFVCEAEFFDPTTDAALIGEFRSERKADYEALAEVFGARDKLLSDPGRVARTRKRFKEISRIDFFQAPGRSRVQSLLARAAARRTTAAGRARQRSGESDLIGRIWATRPGVQVDRIASAWLIRRFVDPKARFRFIDPKEPVRDAELRFDMIGGDFSHEGDRCTFETLLARTGVANRSLTEIAEIVHDIDLKDGKFGRPEAAGLEQLLIGLVLANPEDEARLERGFVLFDELYQSFRKRHLTLSKEVPK